MKIAVQTAGIVNRFGVEEGFRMIREAGFEAVDANLDLWLTPKQIRGGELQESLFEKSDAEIVEYCAPIIDALSRNGLTVTQAHAPFPTRVHAEEVNACVLRAVERTIALCGHLGCPRLVIHPGFLPFAERGSDEWNYNVRMYSALIPALRAHKVLCCLENMFTHHETKLMCGPCATPAEANAWIDALNELAGERLFGFCMDVGHAQLVSQDIRAFILQLGKNLACFHIHDNNGVLDQHLFPYEGIMDWERFCDAVRESGFEGDLSFETYNGLNRYPAELALPALRLAAAEADYFRRRIQG
ncbi:MAG: sugar phosphate isomerase/epimerase [Clostridia bacterium]|nr:sugar phosphate isomerase/epimerase [Clostridia bacterium]